MDLPVTFIWPAMLIGLLLIPALVAVYIGMHRRRNSLIASFGDMALLKGSSSAQYGVRRHVPPLLFLVALAVLLVALARPETIVSLPRLEGTVILAFDVSGSMSANDLKPTRLEAAKAAASDFVQRQPPSVSIGVVTFSGSGFTAQAPTTDQAAILTAINRLKVQSSTSLANGIDAALKLIDASRGKTGDLSGDEPPSLSNGMQTASPTPVPKGSYTSAVIVLLTDGENTQSPDPMRAAQTASDRGVRIYTVGIGSTEGATLHINGFTIRSRLDEATLKQISQVSGGTYYNAQTEEDLQAIYDNLNPQLIMKPQETEVTALFAGVGIAVLLLAGALSLLWLGRVP
jgi:Ca-activated chloride channel family protein